MLAKYKSIVYHPSLMFFKHDGDVLGGPFELTGSASFRPQPVARPKMIQALYEYATSLGISITFGTRVIDYEEEEEIGRVYAVTERGDRLEADLIVAADGIGSKSTKAVLGSGNASPISPISSGFSNYRVAFPTELIYQDAYLAEQYRLRPGDPDMLNVFIGPKSQAIIMVSPHTTTWILTHEASTKARLCQRTDSFSGYR